MFSFLSKIKQVLGDKKTLEGALTFGFISFLLLVPNISNAAFFDIGFNVLSKIAFGISYLIALIGGMFVAVLTISLHMIIQVSTGIVNSTPVQIGFPIVLSIANLGFVLAVIVIAVATILRQEGYGIKKLLANVIIMAVMVNFGLVISGAIIGFSNRITTYFLDSMTGGVTDFASIMAGTMNPQKAFLDTEVQIQDTGEATSTVISIGKDSKDLSRLGAAAKDGGSFGALLIPLFSVFLTIINIVIMIVTLAVILVSFILRYIKITFYLILLPAAWMASIFPGLKSWNGKWWNSFISQVFYPPVVIFFLWLAMRVSTGMSASDGLKFEAVKTGGGFYDFLGNMLGTPLQAILQAVVIAGIMLGGDYAGKAIGVAGAGAATKTAMSMKGWASGKVKRAGLSRVERTKSAVLSNKRIQAGASNMQAFSAKNMAEKARSATGLKKIGFGAAAGAAAVFAPVAGAVRGAGNVLEQQRDSSKKNAVEIEREGVKGLGREGVLNAIRNGAKGSELIALLDKAQKDGYLGEASELARSSAKVLGGKSYLDKETFERYGQKKLYEAARLEGGAGVTEALNKPAAAGGLTAAADIAAKEQAYASAAAGPAKDAAKQTYEAALKALADDVKKITPEGLARMILGGKDPDGNIVPPKVIKQEEQAALIKSLMSTGGWSSADFSKFVLDSQEKGKLADVQALFAGMPDLAAANPQLLRAIQNNGALAAVGVTKADIFSQSTVDAQKQINRGRREAELIKVDPSLAGNPTKLVDILNKEQGQGKFD